VEGSVTDGDDSDSADVLEALDDDFDEQLFHTMYENAVRDRVWRLDRETVDWVRRFLYRRRCEAFMSDGGSEIFLYGIPVEFVT
jgi:hypothetical protein